jgi:hypothetical protein
MQQEPLPENTLYDEIVAALIESEKAITDACVGHFTNNKPITYADLFAMGIARRSLALSSGFRSMVEQRNSLCALPMVRMQLDTALRLYAGFFTRNHQSFCRDVIAGKQIDRLKSDNGQLMKDSYLRDRVAKRNPWIVDVYKMTSGHIHFSDRHIFEALRRGQDRSFQMIIGPTDADREPSDYREPMRCMHHLNLIIDFALKDWLARMCAPGGPVVSAEDYWRQAGAER